MKLDKIKNVYDSEEKSNKVFNNYSTFLNICLDNDIFTYFKITTSLEEEIILNDDNTTLTLYRVLTTIKPDLSYFNFNQIDEKLINSDNFKMNFNISFIKKENAIMFLKRIINDFITNHKINRTFRTGKNTSKRINPIKRRLEEIISLVINNDIFELEVFINTDDEEQLNLAYYIQELAQKKLEEDHKLKKL